MYAHFDFEGILPENMTHKLNSILPNDIVIHTIIKVKEDAHARFDAKSRSYEYKIWMGRNPFLLDTSWQIHHQKVNVSLMNKAAEVLYEYKNFECFSKVKTEVNTFNCSVTEAKWILKGDMLSFHISANSFCKTNEFCKEIPNTILGSGIIYYFISVFFGCESSSINDRNRRFYN